MGERDVSYVRDECGAAGAGEEREEGGDVLRAHRLRAEAEREGREEVVPAPGARAIAWRRASGRAFPRHCSL